MPENLKKVPKIRYFTPTANQNHGGGGIMFRGFWGLKMAPQVPTVIDGYKKIVEKLIHESDHFAPTPTIIWCLEHCVHGMYYTVYSVDSVYES